MKYICILIVSVLLLGCAANGMKYSDAIFTRTPDQSEIYIFRLKNFVAGGACFEVQLDGKPVGVLANGGFLRKQILPGHHVATVQIMDDKQLELPFEAKPNESIYIQHNVALNNSNGISEASTIAPSSNFKFSQGALMHLYYMFAQVRSIYAIEKLSPLNDSSKKISCMTTMKQKNYKSKNRH